MKVSIITVTYNSEATLADTIRSVLRQSYKNIEYWIIDGDSKDGTVEVIKHFEPFFKGNLHWISEADNGLYDAMNKGIRRCTGDVIGILNSDDFFTSNNVIERMVKGFPNDADAVYGDVHFVKANNVHKNIRYYSGRIFSPSLIRFGFTAPHPSFYIRKSVFQKYGCYDTNYRIAADFELIARLCYIEKIKTKYLHIDFVTMRIGGTSTRNLQARLNGAKEGYEACRKLKIKTNMFNIYCKYLIKSISSALYRR